ncbi:MAG: potassium transporter TrkA, partial [Chloroflexi bacterium]|nr:potassium transporter TrkA [Chloroflexota bacterium]
LGMMARSPDLFTLLTSTADSQDVREVRVRNPFAQGIPLKTLGLPGNLLVLSIGRNGDLLIPHGNTRLETGDRVTLIGNVENLNEAEAWLGSSPAD